MFSIKHLLSTSLLATLLPAATSASPAGPPSSGGGGWGGNPNCLTDPQATQVATLWTQLIGNYSKTLADSVLAPNFTDYSDSALTLNNICPQAPVKSPPYLQPVFTSRDQFEAGQGMQKAINSKILQVWNNCATVTMRWVLTNTTNGGRPVAGVILFDTMKAPSGNQYPYQIHTVYSEFDVGAWILNLQDAHTCNKTGSNGF